MEDRKGIATCPSPGACGSIPIYGVAILSHPASLRASGGLAYAHFFSFDKPPRKRSRHKRVWVDIPFCLRPGRGSSVLVLYPQQCVDYSFFACLVVILLLSLCIFCLIVLKGNNSLIFASWVISGVKISRYSRK